MFFFKNFKTKQILGKCMSTQCLDIRTKAIPVNTDINESVWLHNK